MITNLYDRWIEGSAAEWMPMIDWRWLKAQWFQESGLDPNITNKSSGAQGICEFIPGTFAECRDALGMPATASAFEPVCALKCGAYYMRRMWDAWKAPRPDADRLQLAQASYNAGLGNIARAQKLAGMATDYDTIISKLVDVTGEANSAQTRDYVAKIRGWYADIKGEQ